MNDSEILHMAQARELLTTYADNVKTQGRAQANEILERQLKKMPKGYDIGRVKVCMRKVQDEERGN